MTFPSRGMDASASSGTATLASLINGLPIHPARSGVDLDTVVYGLSDDSRKVQPGWLFIARDGHRHDGAAFVQDAIRQGASAVLANRQQNTRMSDAIHHVDVPHLVADYPQVVLGHLSERWFGQPSRQMKLIGVTGTNGKTTVAHVIQQVLQHAGQRCGLIGTVCIDDGNHRTPATLTTPGAVEISALLSTMIANQCEWCVMEVSSHALEQSRVAGLHFAAAIFTNLSGDHLDYHSTLDDYAAAKAKLFAQLDSDGYAIVNADDEMHQRMLHESRAAPTHFSLNACNTDAEFCAEVLAYSLDGTDTKLHVPGNTIELFLPLIGRHNVSNALAAAATCCKLGVSLGNVINGLERVQAPPGRYEPVITPAEMPRILVDYAHTDHALENALQGLRPLLVQQGRLHIVFGCGGDRDRSKRPRMAQVAVKFADHVIVTSDNPRSEEPTAIIEDILRGVTEKDMPRVTPIIDRRAAIHHAIAHAAPEDVVLIAGKGHEDYQIINNERFDFDDRIAAAQVVADLREQVASV